MTLLSNILAAGEGVEDLLQLILLVGAAGVIAVVRWLGKLASQKQDEQQAVEQAQRLQENLETDRAPQAVQAPVQQRPPQQAPQRRRRKPPAQPAEPVVLAPIEHRLVNAQADMPSAVHHDFYAYPGRPGALSHDDAWAAQPVAVDLSNPDLLRQAVIYHELLSPPKALRDESEPWEV